MSIGFIFESKKIELSGYSLMMGVATADVLQTYSNKPIKVKWPNDLLVDHKKLAGILIELKKIEDRGRSYWKFVVGVGINLLMADNISEIDQPYIDLAQCSLVAKPHKSILISELVIKILESHEQFMLNGLNENFLHRWNQLDIHYLKPIELTNGERIIKGIHKGIDHKGSLLIEESITNTIKDNLNQLDSSIHKDQDKERGKLSRWNSGEVRIRK